MKTLLTGEPVQQGIRRMAEEIRIDYGDLYRNLPFMATLEPDGLDEESSK